MNRPSGEHARRILDHPLLSKRYFFPTREPPEPVLTVDCGPDQLACAYERPCAEGRTVIFFHGNGELVADYQPWLARTLGKRGLNLLLAEYRGYGGSTGTPCLGGMLDDVDAILHAAEVPAARVVAFGRSLGSIYALELAARHPDIAGLVLESALADPLERILLRVTPEELGVSRAQLEQAVHAELDHQGKLRRYGGPLLVLHGRNDSLVDVSHGKRLASWGVPSRTRLVLLPDGDHNSVMKASWGEYWAAFDQFVDRSLAADPSRPDPR
jgi:pimeloyl-ACP methyl ester carboxylesterase